MLESNKCKNVNRVALGCEVDIVLSSIKNQLNIWSHSKVTGVVWSAGGKKPLLEEAVDVEDGKETKKETEARPVSYSYSFFNLIFALASMYAAMLLSGWANSKESSDLADVGWTSVWVRICTEWVTAALYVWTLLAPLLFPDREFF